VALREGRHSEDAGGKEQGRAVVQCEESTSVYEGSRHDKEDSGTV
jgi:hypothetical protein